MVKTRAAKRMEKKAQEQLELLQKLLQKSGPSDASWRRAFRPYQTRLKLPPNLNATNATLPTEP
jgi:DNA-binding transcriptional MocR family regulator